MLDTHVVFWSKLIARTWSSHTALFLHVYLSVQNSMFIHGHGHTCVHAHVSFWIKTMYLTCHVYTETCPCLSIYPCPRLCFHPTTTFSLTSHNTTHPFHITILQLCTHSLENIYIYVYKYINIYS